MKAKYLTLQYIKIIRPDKMLTNPYDWIIILVVIAVLFFGASKIPELFRSMGRAVGEFKKGKIEAEMELQQMQQQMISQPLVQQQNTKVQD